MWQEDQSLTWSTGMYTRFAACCNQPHAMQKLQPALLCCSTLLPIASYEQADKKPTGKIYAGSHRCLCCEHMLSHKMKNIRRADRKDRQTIIPTDRTAFLILKKEQKIYQHQIMQGNKHVLCFETGNKTKQEKKNPHCILQAGKYTVICKRGKTSMVNTNYVAQLFKTVSVQIISGRGCYKVRSIITLHFGMTSAQPFGMLKLAQSTACLYWALPVSVPFGSTQNPLPAAPQQKEVGLRERHWIKVLPIPLQTCMFRDPM